MKNKSIICAIMTGALVAFAITRCVAEDDDQVALKSKVKISKETAQQIAQAQVPNGTVKAGELEMEKGKLIWSFGFTSPDSKAIKEVNVNAITGDVIDDVETEKPADQAKEAAQDTANTKKHADDKEDKD